MQQVVHFSSCLSHTMSPLPLTPEPAGFSLVMDTLLPTPQQAPPSKPGSLQPSRQSALPACCPHLRGQNLLPLVSLQSLGLGFSSPTSPSISPRERCPHPVTSGHASPLVRMTGKQSMKSRSSHNWGCIPERLPLAQISSPLSGKDPRSPWGQARPPLTLQPFFLLGLLHASV